MSRRTRLLAVLCLAACAESAPARVPEPLIRPDSAAANATQAAPPFPQYRLASTYPEETPPEQALLGGMRFELKPDRTLLASSVAREPLEGGRAVPGFAGEGFVFWNDDGLFRSSTFLGRLEPLLATPFAIVDVSFGPQFWLLRSKDGERLAFDPTTRTEVAALPTGLVDLEAAADGRVVAVLELGRSLVSTDRGVSYREVQSELGESVSGLSREPLGFLLPPNILVSLAGNGQLSRGTAPVPAAAAHGFRDRRFSGRRPPQRERERWAPLDQAVARGLLTTPERAWAPLGASVAEVDVRSGKLLWQGAQLLPNAPECQLLALGGERVMTCNGARVLSVLSHLSADQPILERSFTGTRELRIGLGELLVEGGCDDIQPLSVCLRSASGEWRQLSLTVVPGATGSGGSGSGGSGGSTVAAALPAARAYVPRADGGAVALSSELAGYVDLTSGQVLKLSGDFGDVLRDPSHCLVDGGGALRCILQNGPVAFDAQGKQEPRAYRFNWTQVAGLRGLGEDKEGRLFQTDDLGRNWVEVQPPPASAPHSSGTNSCSDAGCLVNGWLRVGWEPTPNAVVEAPEIVELVGANAPRLPTLTCVSERATPPAFLNPRLTRDTDTSNEDPSRVWIAGFGVDKLRADHSQNPLEVAAPSQAGGGTYEVMRGLLSTFQKALPDDPSGARIALEPLRFRYVSHFDASARIQLASVTLPELARVARRNGAPSPGVDFEGSGSLATTPVLAREPGSSAGFITMLEHARLWVNGARVTLLTPWDETWSVSGALLERDGALLLLVTGDGEASRVWRFRDGAGVELFGTPVTDLRPVHGTVDALGISEQGDSAVLRFPSGARAPSAADPVLAYAPGKALEQLAPWSHLRLASEPECADKAGYRAIVLPQRSWLTLRRGASEVSEDGGWGMIAVVRWSRERVCLEALEMAADAFSYDDNQLETRLVFTPAQKMAATRVGIASGVELREPQRCTLSAP